MATQSSANSTRPLLDPVVIDGDYQDFPNTSSPPASNKDFQSSPAGSDKYHMDDIIPETHEHRTLVLCFDGTGDQFDADNSNIIQFFSMLKKDDMSQQMVYYQAGIGTYTIPEIATPFMAGLSKTWDMMVGVHLNAHVMGGYEFLMQNYQAGDKICIFGFSRGAYTARALAGMIHKVGLLPVCNHQQVPFAYNMYSRDDETGWKQSTAFKRAFSINVEIEFVGVWDTVSAVGLIPRRLPFTKVSDNIKYFRHAISLDEHRARFNPNTWSHPTEKDKELGVKRHEMPRSKKVHHNKANLHDLERRYSEDTDTTTDVEEVWFSGCHTDVGGGSVVNGTRYSLARIPLRWMLRQCFLAKTGILFHKSIFPKVGLDPDRLYPEVLPRPPPLYQSPACRSPPLKLPWVVTDDRTMVTYSDGGEFVNEEDEDLADALSPHYDQLVLLKGWWILEVLPQKNHYQKDNDNSWVQEYQINMGAGRHIPRQKKDGVKFHRTVKIRMEAEGLKDGKYWPKAKLKVEPKWVD